MSDFYNYILNLGPYQVAGVFGFCCYIAAFGSVQLGTLDGNGAVYSAMNILAASLVAVSLLAEFNLASALIQSSWIAIGVVGLVLRIRGHWRKKNNQSALTPLDLEVS